MAAPITFQNDVDLRAQLEAWHVEVNTGTPSRATGVNPEKHRREELARLRPINEEDADGPSTTDAASSRNLNWLVQ